MKSHLSTKEGNKCCGPCQAEAPNLSPAMSTSTMCLIALSASRIGNDSEDFVDEGLRHLSRLDAQLFHPRKQGSPFEAQAGRGALRAADAPLGFYEDSHNPILFVGVTRFCGS